ILAGQEQLLMLQIRKTRGGRRGIGIGRIEELALLFLEIGPGEPLGPGQPLVEGTIDLVESSLHDDIDLAACPGFGSAVRLRLRPGSGREHQERAEDKGAAEEGFSMHGNTPWELVAEPVIIYPRLSE